VPALTGEARAGYYDEQRALEAGDVDLRADDHETVQQPGFPNICAKTAAQGNCSVEVLFPKGGCRS
jgi:hypothetical protein